MQKIIFTKQIQEYSEHIDQSLIDYLKENQMETFESFPNYDIIAFNWYDINRISRKPQKIVIYIDKEDLFYLCEDIESYEVVNRYYKANEDNETALCLFFGNIFKGSIEHLEEIEDRVSEVDGSVLHGIKKSDREQIAGLRFEVLRLKKYYEQFELIFEELCDNENNLISSKCLKHFKILKNRFIKLSSMVLNLKEYITQVRESYQAQIDIEQNELMKFFTITTSIFLPLTLITGWYGMNLKMPEYSWNYGYPFMIGLCVFVIFAWIFIFKKKKWL